MTDEEIIAQGKILCKAYYLGNAYGEKEAERNAQSITSVTHGFAQQARALAGMADAPTISAQALGVSAFLRKAEQLLADARASLEAEEKKPQRSAKAIAQWRVAVNALAGASHKRGLIPDLRDAGPGAY